MAGLFSSSIETQQVQKIYTEVVISCVDDALAYLSDLERGDWSEEVNDVKLQLRFIKMFLWFFPQWDCHDQNLHFSFFTSIVTTTEYICRGDPYLIDEWFEELELKIRECMTELKKYSEHHISCSLKSNQFTRDEILEFLDLIHANMNGLAAPSKSQIKPLKERLLLLRYLIRFTPLVSGQENPHFEFYVYDWANKAALFTSLHWLNEEEQDEETGEKLQSLHLDLLQKTPELCFEAQKIDTKMVISCVDDALAYFSDIVEIDDWIDKRYLIEEVNDVKLQLRFIKMFLWFFPQWDCHDENLHLIFTSIVTTTETICKIQSCDDEGPDTNYEWLGEVDWMIPEWKTKLKNYSEHLISCSLNSDPFTRDEIVEFLDLIHANMKGLVDESASGKCQIKALKERLFLLRNLIHFTLPMTMSGQQNSYFEFNVYDWANKAARLTILYWLNEEQDEETREKKLQSLHLDLLQKTPELIRLCFGVIKVPKVRHSDTIIFGEFLSRFVDFFLENIVFTLKDDVPMLREGLILLIFFLADPPANAMDHHYDLSFFQKKICAVLDQASHTIIFFGETSMDLTRGKTNVVHLQKSIDEVREKIEKLYLQIPPQPSWSDFPRTNGLGHFEFLLVYLENLKEAVNKNKKLAPFFKHRIFTIKEELMPLKPQLLDIWKMPNEHEEVKDLWEQITSLSYQLDLAIKSSFFVDHRIWYNLTYLSSVVEKIKDIQSNVIRIKDISRTGVVSPLMSSVVVLKEPTSTSIVEDVVGFKRDTKVLINELTRGTTKLDIISLVGMGGIGKTTLAKKLFNDPSIISHFHKRAFCSVSQEYIKRNVLLDILSDLCMIDGKIRQMSDDDLAHELKKCLSGCKYLIVMDDIWDIDHWYDVRASFPENNNRSRIIFTTRISDISLIAKPDSSPYLLPFLSVDESWELLKQKIFHKNPCPPHLCEVGKLIAEKCKGLPLTIVVIAGLLRRMEIHLSHWNEVADAVPTFASSSEGYKDVIRLSYIRLPEHLKSCFLYLGAFPEDEKIMAKKLTNLWVAEGFVLKSGSSCCLRKAAKQYLNELGDRNLVSVTRRSCNGWIKHFYVHDLIRDFCRTEAQEQHYWCFVNSHNSKVSMPSVCGQYRVCIEDEWRSFVDSKTRGPTVHSLLHYSKYYEVMIKSLESFLCNFKLVQVLDLRMVKIVGEFPTTITTLVQLRYLALQFYETVKVPSEISNLWNLETLLLIGEFLKVQFPCNFWKMKRLRHVEGGDKAYVELDDVSGVDSQLPNLETFKSLVIPPGKDGVELLRRLPNVWKLSYILSREYNQIPELDIHTNMESLHMRGDLYVGVSLRMWDTIYFPLTIRKLILESFKLRWNEFTAVIRELPNLQVLKLRDIRSSDDDKIWDVEDEEFPNIISLKLFSFDIEEWKASIDSFPCIKKLNLSSCDHLIQVPPCFGEVPTLESVKLTYCNKRVEDSARQIQKDQLDDLGNEINLQIVNLRIDEDEINLRIDEDDEDDEDEEDDEDDEDDEDEEDDEEQRNKEIII